MGRKLPIFCLLAYLHAVLPATDCRAARAAGAGRLLVVARGKVAADADANVARQRRAGHVLVRFPFGDAAVNEKLWEQIDEQQFAPDLRERLAQNGFRVGVVSGQMPVELSKLMELSDKPAPTGRLEGVDVSNLETQPRVVRRHVQTRAGQGTEILASSIYPELTVLLRGSDQLSGATYQLAQGVFTAKAFPQPDGRTRLQLVPELQHDQPRPQWDIRNQGVLRLVSDKPKEVYDDMAIAADLPCARC